MDALAANIIGFTLPESISLEVCRISLRAPRRRRVKAEIKGHVSRFSACVCVCAGIVLSIILLKHIFPGEMRERYLRNAERGKRRALERVFFYYYPQIPLIAQLQ